MLYIPRCNPAIADIYWKDVAFIYHIPYGMNYARERKQIDCLARMDMSDSNVSSIDRTRVRSILLMYHMYIVSFSSLV